MRRVGAEDTILRISAPNLEILGVPYSRCLLNVPFQFFAFVIKICFTKGCYSGDILVEEMLRQVFLSIRQVEKVTLSAWCIKVWSLIHLLMWLMICYSEIDLE